MLTWGSPAFLAAGALAALVPLLLHLIRRRPPNRAALPTTRFLTDDPRTSIRASRPTDLLLLALRVLFLLLAGAAFARPLWVPAPRGTREIVLLDRGTSVANPAGWRRGVEAARRALLAPDGSTRGELILFDTTATRVPTARITAALFDSLASSASPSAEVNYAAALRAVPPTVRELRGADSIRITLLSALRWGGWRDGIGALRPVAWPGTLVVRDLGIASAPSAPADSARRSVAVVGGGRFAGLALSAAGWVLEDIPTGVIFQLAPLDGAGAAAVRQRVNAGATLVVDPSGAGAATFLPVDGPIARATDDAGEVWFSPELRLAGAARRVALRPRPGATVLAAWDDGRPAAVAARVGRGCVVVFGTKLEEGALPLSPAFPLAMDRLARGCDPEGDARSPLVPLDRGAREILRGSGPATLAASSMAAGSGTPLGRWLLGAALLVALAET
ncbi:MAG TPA: BatA domain-containing protein, partial [Longimicrobium sp.]|nr:BatA domain-containing protein [Longimicrobium sp.]